MHQIQLLFPRNPGPCVAAVTGPRWCLSLLSSHLSPVDGTQLVLHTASANNSPQSGKGPPLSVSCHLSSWGCEGGPQAPIMGQEMIKMIEANRS